MCECCCNCANYCSKDNCEYYFIEEMQIGDKGWIAPWQINVKGFISFDTYDVKMRGTAKIRIEKIAPNAYKILANMADGEYKYIKVGYVVIEKP